MFNKSLTTNIAALAIIGVSYLSPKYNEMIYLIGLVRTLRWNYKLASYSYVI